MEMSYEFSLPLCGWGTVQMLCGTPWAYFETASCDILERRPRAKAAMKYVGSQHLQTGTGGGRSALLQ